MTSLVKGTVSRYTGSYGQEDAQVTGPKVALILGVTGIVGKALLELLLNPSTPGYPWKVYGVARRPKPRWLRVEALREKAGAKVSEEHDAKKAAASVFHYIQLDLLNREDTLEKLSRLTDVTHFFWTTWMLAGEKEEENIKVNGAMYKNALDAVVREDGNLEHITLQTGIKYYLGPFETLSKIPLPDLPFGEDEPRLPAPNFYHNQEDMTLEAVKRTNGKVTWAEHRPSWIFGFAPRNMMNIVGTLAAYALICKHDQMPFVYPGNSFTWEYLNNASDASLIAEQELWAALDPRAKNQAFNITNGDVYNFKKIWHLLGERFDLEVPENKPEHESSFQQLMKDKGPTWEAIVKNHKLEPTRMEEVGHWWYADAITHLTVENVSSMNKSRRLGFLGWRNTEECLRSVLDEMKLNKIIP